MGSNDCNCLITLIFTRKCSNGDAFLLEQSDAAPLQRSCQVYVAQRIECVYGISLAQRIHCVYSVFLLLIRYAVTLTCHTVTLTLDGPLTLNICTKFERNDGIERSLAKLLRF